jgi:hypothetical protein
MLAEIAMRQAIHYGGEPQREPRKKRAKAYNVR